MTIKTGFGDQPAVPSIDRETCTLCGLCARACKSETLTMGEGEVKIDCDTPFGCVGCGQCMMVCPTGSMTVIGRDISPEDLVDLPPREQRATADQLEALLLARRSVREYSQREVEREVIDRILEIASTAPMGIPPSDVGVIVFHGREKVQEFAEDIVRLYGGVSKFANPIAAALMRPFVGKEMMEAFKTFIIPLAECLMEKRAEGIDWLFYDAPAALLFHVSRYADPVDGAIASTYAMTAAESLGLGTCMIGSVAPALERSKKLMAKYGIPKGNKPVMALTLGYADLEYQRAVRRRFASVSYA